MRPGEVTYIVRTTGARNAFLLEALLSVAGQSRPSRAVVILDGKPEARSEAFEAVTLVVAEASRHGLVADFDESGACSMPGAWNAGWKHVKSEYVGTLDDDDVLYAHHAEVLARELDAHPGVGVVHGRVAMYRCDKKTNQPQAKLHEWGRAFTPEELRAANRIPNHGAIARTETMRLACPAGSFLPSDERDGPCCDYGWWLRLAKKGVVFRSVDELVAEYRIREHRDSNGFPWETMDHYTHQVRARWA